MSLTTEIQQFEQQIAKPSFQFVQDWSGVLIAVGIMLGLFKGYRRYFFTKTYKFTRQATFDPVVFHKLNEQFGILEWDTLARGVATLDGMNIYWMTRPMPKELKNKIWDNVLVDIANILQSQNSLVPVCWNGPHPGIKSNLVYGGKSFTLLLIQDDRKFCFEVKRGWDGF